MDKIEQVRGEIKRTLDRYYPERFSKYCPNPPTLAEPDKPFNCPNDCSVCLIRELLQIPLNGVTIEEVIKRD